MKVLGISGSPRKNGTTSKLVKEILDSTGLETEYVSLSGKNIAPCRFCLACAKDNICKIKDDMEPLRDMIINADAYVIGGCNMWSTLNGLTHNFLERFFQFHHMGNRITPGKPAIVAGAGGGSGEPPASVISEIIKNFGIKTIGTVTAQGAFACYSCGLGETCKVSMVKDFLDENGKINMSFKPELCEQKEVLIKAGRLGKKLANEIKEKK